MSDAPAGSADFDVPRFCARFLAQDHNGLMGLRYLSHSDEHLELELPFNSEFLNGEESGMADGAIITLLDMAGTVSVWARLNRWRPHATIDLRVDHLVPPPPTSIRCKVQCYHLGEELARVQGTAFSDGMPVANYTATYAFTDVRA